MIIRKKTLSPLSKNLERGGDPTTALAVLSPAPAVLSPAPAVPYHGGFATSKLRSGRKLKLKRRQGIESHGSDDARLQCLASNILKRLRDSPQHYPQHCIYRVPKMLRQINEEAYTPLLVSIGPLHHGETRLLPMEHQKLRYLKSFLDNSDGNVDYLLDDCLRIIRDKETQLRGCYADPLLDFCSDDFIMMVLVDAAFIIEFFRKMISPQEVEYIYDMQLLLDIVLCDIKLVENQLPFSILDKLYRNTIQDNGRSTSPSFTYIACVCLFGHHYRNFLVSERQHYYHLLDLIASNKQINPTHSESTENDDHDLEINLALIRESYQNDLVTNLSLSESEEDLQINLTHPGKGKDIKFAWGLDLPPATQLHAAGVKFQVIKKASNMFDIKFDEKKGILKMPKVQLNDQTECICRNLIAFEQGKCVDISDTRYFTDYYSFLNCLINTDEDVQLLAEAGIIQNLMGSHQQASDLINSLSTHASTSIRGHHYSNMSLQLQNHCKKRWPRYRATLMHTYFNHPWAAISVVYAIVLLLLTIAQLVVGIMSIPKV